MKEQSQREHAGTQAYVVVDPVRRTVAVMQCRHMRADPGTDVRERIDIPAHWIWFVLIDRRCPVNGHTTQDEADKDWHVQPMAASRHQVMLVNRKHAGLTLRRARSIPFFIELHGTGHKHSPR
jgi:hypothetical protein